VPARSGGGGKKEGFSPLFPLIIFINLFCLESEEGKNFPPFFNLLCYFENNQVGPAVGIRKRGEGEGGRKIFIFIQRLSSSPISGSIRFMIGGGRKGRGGREGS